uniref:Anoctamin n=2 Tax=Mesocestoides corti TaxID=53468 RepID=A0A5K3FUF6_MESCO
MNSCLAMDGCVTCEAEFYMTVCACSQNDSEHRSKHNSIASIRLAEMLSSASSANESHKLDVSSCCSSDLVSDQKPLHKKHYLLVRVSRPLLQHCVSVLNQCFAGVFADENNVGTAVGVATLTPAQKAWLGGLAVRLVKLSTEQKEILSALKSCKDFDTISSAQVEAHAKTHPSPPIASLERESALFCMKSEELIKEMTPIHNISERATVWANFRSQSPLFPSVNWLRWYLGDAIGFYFAWLHYYCLALIVPSSVGLLTWVILAIASIFSSKDGGIDDPEIPSGPPPISIFRIYYGLVVIVWAIACTKIWRRQQIQLSEEWLSPVLVNAADMSGWIKSHMNQLRPSFYGIERESPVTGEIELHFPASRRRILYLISASITFFCVLIALFINVLLMNLEGLINPSRSPHLHFRFIACLCDPGRIFDPKAGSLKFVPGILHPLIVFFINQIVFRRIAESLTDMENHETQANWDRSLIVKRFLFEAVDAYASPFHLGMILVDWPALQSFLLTTFATDSIRRLIAECLVPWASSHWRSRRSASALYKKTDNPQHQDTAVHNAVFGVEYEPFDDFLEMVLEHGYIVLFAFACPPYLACMALVCAWVESYFDAFKLLQLVRRPMPQLLHRDQNIWLMLLSVQAWLALFTNICLLACRTDWSLGTLFFMEHVLIGIGLVIELGVSNTPIAAKNAFRRRVYERYRRVAADR